MPHDLPFSNLVGALELALGPYLDRVAVHADLAVTHPNGDHDHTTHLTARVPLDRLLESTDGETAQLSFHGGDEGRLHAHLQLVLAEVE